jgi:hypothetical protein
MSLEEYVANYNALVAKLKELGNKKYKPVKQFTDRPTAERQLRELGETLEAIRSAAAEAEAAHAREADDPEEIKNDIEDGIAALHQRSAEAGKARDAVAPKAKKAKGGKRPTEPPPAKKAKVKAKDKPTVKDDAELSPAERALDVRPGTNKAKLLAYLVQHKKEVIPRSKLIAVVYGKAGKEFVSPFSACINGLTHTMKEKKWGSIVIEKPKEGKEVSFVFNPTKP